MAQLLEDEAKRQARKQPKEAGGTGTDTEEESESEEGSVVELKDSESKCSSTDGENGGANNGLGQEPSDGVLAESQKTVAVDMQEQNNQVSTTEGGDALAMQSQNPVQMDFLKQEQRNKNSGEMELIESHVDPFG